MQGGGEEECPSPEQTATLRLEEEQGRSVVEVSVAKRTVASWESGQLVPHEAGDMLRCSSAAKVGAIFC